MNKDLVFYTHPASRGRMVRWMLEEVGQPYRAEVIAYGAIKAPSYLAINPMGKIPALRHGDVVVTECAAICAYLADAFPTAGLAPPPGDAARGPYYRWLFFAAGPLEAAITNQGMGFVVPDDKRVMSGYGGSLATVLDTLDGWLAGHQTMSGGAVSAADIYVGSHLMWGMQFGMIPKRPTFEAYVARLQGRPAAIRAKDIDDALMAQHPVAAPPARS